MKQSIPLIAGAVALSAALVLLSSVHADHAHEKNDPKRKHHGLEREHRYMAAHWREHEHKEDLREAEMGKYADLYLQPARPAHARYTKQDMAFSAEVKYAVASKALNNAGTAMDIGHAAVSDDKVRLRDMLFASELVAQGVTQHRHDYVPVNDGTYAPSSAVDTSAAATKSLPVMFVAGTVAVPALALGAVEADRARTAPQILADAAAVAPVVVAAIETRIPPIDAATRARLIIAAITAYTGARPVIGGGANAAVALAATNNARTAAILAASSLAANSIGVFSNDAYLGYLADDAIKFTSERRRLDVGLNVNHYFFDHRLALGVNIPVVDVRHMMRLEIDDNIEKTTRVKGQIDSLAAAMYRYDGDQEMLEDFFAAKGMSTLGGTSTGIGDVELYAQARIDVQHLDRALVAVRLVCPSAPTASSSNLWGPERGNGGFFQTGLSFSGQSHYSNSINPHFFIEGVYSLPAMTNQRVPKLVEVTNGMDQAALGALTPLGYRLDNAGRDFKAFNSPFRGLGDTVSKLKTAKGLAFDVRVGNLFEQVFVRRAELDVFYNFKIKGRDRVYNLPASNYNLAAYEKDSDMIEHRLGGEWRWQVNHAATVCVGLEQVLWGKNVAQDTQVSASINYGF